MSYLSNFREWRRLNRVLMGKYMGKYNDCLVDCLVQEAKRKSMQSAIDQVNEMELWRRTSGNAPFAVLSEIVNKVLVGRTVPKTVPFAKKIISSGKVMVVIWDDGAKTRATCSDADPFDVEIGFAMCLVKKLYGKKKLAKILKKTQIQSAKLKKVPAPRPEPDEGGRV